MPLHKGADGCMSDEQLEVLLAFLQGGHTPGLAEQGIEAFPLVRAAITSALNI